MLVTTDARQESVARCCVTAAAAGVHAGMNLAEARALCPNASMAMFDPARSRESMELLARWCMRYSPTVCIDPTATGVFGDGLPDGVLLDLTGEEHLFGTEYLLLHELMNKLERVRMTARLAAAPTLGAAWALARFGRNSVSVTTAANLGAALDPLPIMALRIDSTVHDSLRQVGVERIAQLAALPRDRLASRFGDSLLLRFDQLYGRASEIIEPIRATEPICIGRGFDGATIQLEALTLTVQELLEELAHILLCQESGVRQLVVEYSRIDAPAVSREVLLGRASRDVKHLWSLLRPKVEAMNLGYGVEAVTLKASWIEVIKHEQLTVWGGGNPENDAGHDVEHLLDTLVNRCGTQQVLRACAVPSYVPEIARQFVPLHAKQSRQTRCGQMSLLFEDRPSFLLDKPEAVEAMALLPDHPPARIRWQAQDHSIQSGVGPERIVTEWWEGRYSTRDYFKVQNEEGLWLWVFRELETSRWFVHGLWV